MFDMNLLKEEVFTWMQENKPDFTVTDGAASEVWINGRRLNLENLFRMCNHEQGRLQEIVAHYLSQLFSEEAEQPIPFAWDTAIDLVFPRLQPNSIFEHLNREAVAHQPFVQDTSIVYVTDLPTMTTSITTEKMLQWRKSPDELMEVAIKNLQAKTEQGDETGDKGLKIIESKEGGWAALYSIHDGYDAARLLLPDLHERLAPELGGDFYVGIPARDLLVAISASPAAFVNRIRLRVNHDFERLPYPISPHLFLVTRDGITATFGQEENDVLELNPADPRDKTILERVSKQEAEAVLLAKQMRQQGGR